MNKSENNDSNKDHFENIQLFRLIIKTSILLFIFISLSTTIDVNFLGRFSFYNSLFPGRERFPFGENPEKSYNFTINNIDAMFASHVISGSEKKENEYRIFIVGDSSSWGILLKPEDTLAGLLNTTLSKCNGKVIRVYNLGYPTLSLTKDVMIMEYAMRYSPDLIIWPLTLESFPLEKQINTPLVRNNLDQIAQINKHYELQSQSVTPIQLNLIDRSIIGQRKEIADLIRLQLYGLMWAATGIDQTYPQDFQHAQIDLENSAEFHELNETDSLEDNLAIYVLDNMNTIVGDVPIVFINEPVLISNGANSDIRYNFYYPKWAYDAYRQLISDYMVDNNWLFLDVWDLVPMQEFTNSAIHLTQEGEHLFSTTVMAFLEKSICKN